MRRALQCAPSLCPGLGRALRTSTGRTRGLFHRLRAGRRCGQGALLRWEQSQLADASGVSLSSIKRLEGQPGELNANRPTIASLRQALELPASNSSWRTAAAPAYGCARSKEAERPMADMTGHNRLADLADRVREANAAPVRRGEQTLSQHIGGSVVSERRRAPEA
jgi:hypothetical protein